MDSAAQLCHACGFDNPRAWRACSRCGHPLGSVKAMTGRTYLTGASDETVVDTAPSFDEAPDTPEETSLDGQPPTPPEDIEPPLVGQPDAVQAIHAGVETALEKREPTLVVLEGERGSGKTRLLFHASEVAARMRDDVRVLYGACRPQGNDGYYAPFGRMLLERFGVTPSSSPSTVRGQMATAVGEALGSSDAIAVAETTHLLGHLAGVPFPDSPFLREGDDPGELRERATAAFTRFVEGDASRRPVLVLLDNMEAAEDDGWELVRAALAAQGPVAVVVAGAPPVSERADAVDASGGKVVGPIAPFTEADVASFVHVLLPNLGEAPEPVVAALTHRSGGHPSALRELLFALVEAQLFRQEADGSLVADVSKLEAGTLPVTLEDAIRARLARLDSLERATLDRASVVGEVFMDRCLLAMMRSERKVPGDTENPETMWPDDDDEQALAAALARLEEKGFVERMEQSDVPGTQEYRFLHSDSRDLVYAEQDEALRIERHRTVAHWLSVVIELQRQGLAALAAPHLEKAGMKARAGRAYLEAAHAEHGRIHTQTALRYAEKALELVDPGDIARRIDALHLYGSLQTTLGRYDDARRAFTEMLEVAWRIGARNKGGAALNRLARIHRQRGEYPQADRLLERALELFRAAGDLRGVASTLDDLAQVARLRGDLDRALGAGSEALDIRRSHADVRGESVSLMTLGAIEYARGQIEAAEQLFESAREIRESIGDRPGVMQVYNALGVVAFDRGDHERAEACWRAALQEARKMADRHTQTSLLNNLGEALMTAGRLEEARTHLLEARTLAHELKNRRAMAEVERNLGLTALRAGTDDAEPTLMRALALAEEYGSREAIGLAHRAIGQLRMQTLFDDKGEVSRRAEESFLASIDTFRDIGNEKEAARSLAQLGFHLIERGDTDSARERLGEARALMRRMGLAELAKVERTLEDLGGAITAH
ncbi:MAG TPA: tetratricopeptide repeat protein [Sandaracinaceae bacterium LLY-WYZ-13_1]|nr:tetratricopeptide repeat protein [Sandaracinaceae bacterium LLY-WYZ-13_1]